MATHEADTASGRQRALGRSCGAAPLSPGAPWRPVGTRQARGAAPGQGSRRAERAAEGGEWPRKAVERHDCWLCTHPLAAPRRPALALFLSWLPPNPATAPANTQSSTGSALHAAPVRRARARQSNQVWCCCCTGRARLTARGARRRAQKAPKPFLLPAPAGITRSTLKRTVLDSGLRGTRAAVRDRR